MRRSFEILRSVLPEDATQFVFLVGTICLFIGPLLPWGPRLAIRIPPLLNPMLIHFLGLLIILFAGAAGFFVCFRPGNRPARRLFLSVCLPALVAFTVECGFYVYGAIEFSALRTGSPSFPGAAAALMRIAKIATGFHYALIGFSLVVLFTLLVRSGFVSLPLTLPKADFPPDDAVPWGRLNILVWVLVVWFPALWSGSLILLALVRVPTVAPLLRNVWVAAALSYALPFGICLALAACLIGKQVWRTLHRSVRLPLPEMFLLALALSVGIVLTDLAVDHYVLGLAKSPFGASTFHSVFIFSLVVSAFCEEVIFRGLLQPWFVSRYGILRGILLVSVVWAGGHLWHDFSGIATIATDKDVLLQLSGRLLGCLGGGVMLGWLALRSRSILPGTVAHAVYNSFAESPDRPQGALYYLPMFILLLLAGYMLFRYWPVPNRSDVAV